MDADLDSFYRFSYGICNMFFRIPITRHADRSQFTESICIHEVIVWQHLNQVMHLGLRNR